ncbi:MAG: amidohydrolase [Bacteriovoracaceae bacterium]|nr:amidohydrolase [Bacteriovoracaceae bacterium]
MRCLPFVLALTLTSSLVSAQDNQLYKNAQIYTMDETKPWADSMIVQGEKILAVGRENELRNFGPFQSETDLKNKFVMPGIHDNHTHPIGSGVEYAECMLYDAENVEHLLEIIKKCNDELPAGTLWLRGSGWTIYLFENGAKPHKDMLDKISTTRPMALMSGDGHSYWANSAALKLAKLTPETKDPVDGHLGRDEQGQLTGMLYEGALSFLDSVIPPRTLEQRLAGLKKALSFMREAGITSFKDAYVTQEELETYVALDREGGLTATAHLSLYADTKLELNQINKFQVWKKNYSSAKIHINTVKIYMDGVLEDQTAALLKPYVGSTEAGEILWSKSKLRKFAVMVDKAGFQMHFHAIGDAAIRTALDVIELAQTKNGKLGHRHEISHLQLIHPQDWSRFKKLDVSAVFSPLWAMDDEVISQYTAPLIGPLRAKWIYPMGSVAKAGGRMAFGSDWSVTSMNPLEGIEVALTRTPLEAQTPSRWLIRERLDLKTALMGYTVGGAYATFSEQIAGSLSPGKRADFIILDKNPFKVTPMKIGEIKIIATYHLGKLLN